MQHMLPILSKAPVRQKFKWATSAQYLRQRNLYPLVYDLQSAELPNLHLLISEADEQK